MSWYRDDPANKTAVHRKLAGLMIEYRPCSYFTLTNGRYLSITKIGFCTLDTYVKMFTLCTLFIMYLLIPVHWQLLIPIVTKQLTPVNLVATYANLFKVTDTNSVKILTHLNKFIRSYLVLKPIRIKQLVPQWF